MRRIIAVLGVIIGLGGSAWAADLPPSPPPRAPAVYVPAVPVYNWAGVYVGINGGSGWGNGKFTIAPNTAFPTGLSGTPNDNGGVVGGRLGANFQTGGFVFGVEGDWDYSAINTGTTLTICNISGNCQTGNN
jgi:outer membrane immunogenic protein